MSRKLAITARQVAALCKGASEAGYIPEVTIGDVVVRFLPEALISATSRPPDPGGEAEDWDLRRPFDGPNLNHREERVLQVLVEAGGQPLPAGGIPYAGPHTVNGLIALGFLTLEEGAKTFHRSQDIRATSEGIAFVKRRAEHYSKYWHF